MQPMRPDWILHAVWWRESGANQSSRWSGALRAAPAKLAPRNTCVMPLVSWEVVLRPLAQHGSGRKDRPMLLHNVRYDVGDESDVVALRSMKGPELIQAP